MRALFDAWHEWFFLRWKRGEGFDHVLFAEYDGFGGEF